MIRYEDYDALNGDGAENYPYTRPQDYVARPSAGANLMGLAVCASILGILIYTAPRQVTG
jgi:hypothetical protein